MKKVLIRIIDNIFNPFYGLKQCQSFFGFLHSISLKGMNLRYYPIGDNGEKWLITKIHNYYKQNTITPVIFDIGANRGDYSQELLQTFHHQLRLYSFEPSPRTYQVLQNNPLLSHPNVSLHNIGFNHETTKAKFSYNIKDPATSSLYTTSNIEEIEFEEVQLQTIDEFCHLHQIYHIQFIKIDVEGNEINVLQGASQLIKSHKVDFIQFEFGPRNVDSRTFLKDFYTILGEKFNIYRILKNGLYSLNPYHQDYEAFYAGNYVAINQSVNMKDFYNEAS